MLKQLPYFAVQLFSLLIGIGCKRIARCSSPDQVVGVGSHHVDHQSPDFIGVHGCRCISEAAEAAKTPAATTTKTVIEGVDRLLGLGLLKCVHDHVTAGWYLPPAF